MFKIKKKMNFLIYTILAILTANKGYADYLQCYVCEDCEDNEGFLEYCPPLEEVDLIVPNAHGATTTTESDVDIPAQAVFTTSNTPAVVDPGSDSTTTGPTENTTVTEPVGPTSMPIRETSAAISESLNNTETNNFSAVMGNNSALKPTTNATKLETTTEIDESNLTSPGNAETNNTDDILENIENIVNLDPEFSRPTVNSDNNTTSNLNSTETTQMNTTDVEVSTNDLNELATYPQGDIKPILNITEANNMTVLNTNVVSSEQGVFDETTSLLPTPNLFKENLTSFESIADSLTNKTLNPNVDALTTLFNKENEKPTNTSLNEDTTLAGNNLSVEELDETLDDYEESDLDDQGEISTGTNFENVIEDSVIRPVGATLSETSSEHLLGVPNGTEVSLGPISAIIPNSSINLTNLQAVEMNNISTSGLMGSAIDTLENKRPLPNPINSTTTTNVLDLLELMKPQSGLVANPTLLEGYEGSTQNQTSGGRFQRSTTTKKKHDPSQSRNQTQHKIPILVSRFRNNRVLAQMQTDNITYKCYTVHIKGQNKIQINKGCLAVPAERAALGILASKYGLETLEDCQVCSETKCNRSSGVGLIFAVKSLGFIMFMGWLAH